MMHDAEVTNSSLKRPLSFVSPALNDPLLPNSEGLKTKELQWTLNSGSLRRRIRMEFERSVKSSVDKAIVNSLKTAPSAEELRQDTDEIRIRLSKLETSITKVRALAKAKSQKANAFVSSTPSHPTALAAKNSIEHTSNLTKNLSNGIRAPHPLSGTKYALFTPVEATSMTNAPQNQCAASHTPGSLQDQKKRLLQTAEFSHKERQITYQSIVKNRVRPEPPPMFIKGRRRSILSMPMVPTEDDVGMVMAYMNSLATPELEEIPRNTSIAPLPAWHPTVIPTDLMGRPTLLRSQPPLRLVISAADEGVCLRWELSQCQFVFEPAVSYELYSYASTDAASYSTLTSQVWQKVGEVEAMTLPMACTLTSVIPNNIYYFAVRSVDRYSRVSDWSNVVVANVN